MDRETLLEGLEFARARLLATLDGIEKSGRDVSQVLAWRPGPGRAHIGWQAMHCAATLDRYLNVRILGQTAKDEELVRRFAGGSTPADDGVPTLAEIRQKLASTFEPLKKFVAGLSPAELERKIGAPGQERTLAQSLVLLAWHEGHHQGQIHLTWNLYQAAHPK